MKHRALQNALKAQRGLSVALAVFLGNQGRRRIDKFDQVTAQTANVGAAGFQHPNRIVVVEQRQQQMLYRHELVAFGPGATKGVVERLFQILAKHASPSPLAFGCFDLAQQGMFMFTGVLIYLGRLGFGDVPRKNAADALALSMHCEHNMGRLFAVHAEKNLQHFHDKLHRRVVVVDQYHFEQRRALEFRSGLFECQTTRGILLLVTHTPRNASGDQFHGLSLFAFSQGINCMPSLYEISRRGKGGRAAGKKKGPCRHEPAVWLGAGRYIASTIACPNSEQLSRVAPSIWRSKS